MKQAFYSFDVEKVAAMSKKEIKNLRKNPHIIINLLKINATVTNVQAFIRIQDEFGSFNSYIWKFTCAQVIHNEFKYLAKTPNKTLRSEEISKSLKVRGLKLMGSTICYAFMQATGMVNDHTIDCFIYK